MERFPQLPNCRFTDSLPAFYDTDSRNAIEQTANLRGTMRSLIDNYNKFVQTLTDEINKFVDSTNEDQEGFKNNITKIMHDYIMMLDDKINMLDAEVTKEVQDFINQAIAEGKIVITTAYDENNENLNIVGGA